MNAYARADKNGLKNSRLCPTVNCRPWWFPATRRDYRGRGKMKGGWRTAVGECRGPHWAMSKPGFFPRYNVWFLSSLQLPVSFLAATSDLTAMLPCADQWNGQRCMSDSAFQWLQFVLLDPSPDICRHQWTCCAVTYFQGFNNNNNKHSNAPNPPVTIHLLG